MSAVVGASGQHGVVGNHSRPGEAQPELEPIILQLLSGAVPIVGLGLEAPIPGTAGVGADRQGQGIKRLHGIGGLPPDLGQALVDQRFELPEVGGLAGKLRAVGQGGEEVLRVGVKVGEPVLVGV